jgi:hypothetical protein
MNIIHTAWKAPNRQRCCQLKIWPTNNGVDTLSNDACARSLMEVGVRRKSAPTCVIASRRCSSYFRSSTAVSVPLLWDIEFLPCNRWFVAVVRYSRQPVEHPRESFLELGRCVFVSHRTPSRVADVSGPLLSVFTGIMNGLITHSCSKPNTVLPFSSILLAV